jgi:hypothetical protein
VRNREGNRPDRRYALQGTFTQAELEELCTRLRYSGSSYHKLHPADYGLVPPFNPRPTKSLCDGRGAVLLDEAECLFKAGIKVGLISSFDRGSSPKYVWSVNKEGEVYEAKTKPPDVVYHGYRLGEDEEAMCRYILDEWKRR